MSACALRVFMSRHREIKYNPIKKHVLNLDYYILSISIFQNFFSMFFLFLNFPTYFLGFLIHFSCSSLTYVHIYTLFCLSRNLEVLFNKNFLCGCLIPHHPFRSSHVVCTYICMYMHSMFLIDNTLC